MKKYIFSFITIIGVILSSGLIFAESDQKQKSYSLDLYDSEVEQPDTYDSYSPYKGVASSQNINRMLEDIRRLNEMSKVQRALQEARFLEERVELPKLSEVFGREVLFRLTRGPGERIFSEGISIKELAEAIVKELVKLRKEGKLPPYEYKKEEITVSRKKEGSLEEVEEGAEEKSATTEIERIYEREVKFKQEAITITYLIFGKRVIIEVPMILAQDLEEKEARLKRELEHMALRINEIGRQR